MHIRPFAPADLSAFHAINVAGEPGVGAVSAARLEAIITAGNCLVAERDGAALGFILMLGGGADYDSANYRWFDERYESYLYVDRIAIAPDARGQGIGAALYKAAFAQTGDALLMGCEVNTAPPNPRSMQFHQRLGFAEVGRHAFAPDYAVAYLMRRLSA